jgi:phosphate transport system protein
MSHYEERLEQDLERIRCSIADMADKVQAGIGDAVRALQTGDNALAAKTILADHPINRAMREIDRLCHAFIAVHLPSGRHLRQLSSSIRANIALERIGDYAVTIARVSHQLTVPPGGETGRELDRIANQTQVMLGQAIKALNDLNAETAKATMVMEQEIEYDLDAVYNELTANQDRERVKDLLAVFVVLNHLKRVADQAKNLCEETVFTVTGEGKRPKVYNILFVDEGNAGLSQMAEAIARNRYPGSGTYASGGTQPAAAIDEAMAGFMESHGFDMSTAKPGPLDLTHSDLVAKHVIVSLQGPVKSYIPEIPFHTTALEWDVGPVPETGADPGQWEALYRDIASLVRELMETLRGADAP